MSTAAPGYATTAQVALAARIRAEHRRGASVLALAAEHGLSLSLVRRMLSCHSKEGAAKLLAEYVTRCKEKNVVVSI